MILPGMGRGTGEAGGGGARQALRPEVAIARHRHPIVRHVVDLRCRKAKLVAEIDGEAHDRADRPARDAVRDRFLEENGYGILRVGAVDVLRDIDGVRAAIVARAALPLHQPSAGSPPRAGEE